MALGLGLGLPFTAGRRGLPPQAQALFGYWEPPGRVNTSGEVSSWPSAAPGSLTITGASGERPDISGNITTFNGSTDRLTFAGNAFGATDRATFGAWVKVAATIALNDTLLYTSDLSAGYLGLGTFNNARWIAGASGATAGNMNGSADGTVRPGVWQFVSVVFDGTQAVQADRLRIWLLEHGQTAPELQGQVPGGTIPASLTVGGGTGAIGDLVGFSRQLPFDTTAMYLYKGAALSSAEVAQLARRVDPLATKRSVLALGDSITLGVGDTAGNGGYRTDLLATAGGQEAFWYAGTIQSGTVDVNNRCQAVGGSKVDAHLTQLNTALSAGWNPDIIIYCGGRNDISAGEVSSLPSRYNALFAAFGGRRAIVHVVPPSNPTGSETATANGHLATAAAAYPNITVVDGALSSPGDLFDSVHPNAGGYAKMASAIWAVLSPLL